MRRRGRAHWLLVALAAMGAAGLVSCKGVATPTSAAVKVNLGDCVSVTNLDSDDAAPVRRVPCTPVYVPISNDGEAEVYRVVFETTLPLPVTKQQGGDDLARLYCTGPEITPGRSLYVYPTEASFAEGFNQFLCLAP